ncbi:MAG: hypothetical protein JRI49_06805, partial [Deltaproteobacteria bacterium]|nr:hypothetical protein [Deltaproteobacteria bacterium]
IVDVPVSINIVKVSPFCPGDYNRTSSHSLESPHGAVYSTGKALKGLSVEHPGLFVVRMLTHKPSSLSLQLEYWSMGMMK